ncbi:hypothetical protein FOXG_20848 [Fusarium oxysporum f. sp. lycopersici 4287]|uniref:Uncharacterized protein n=3 Tax=Fusarium oxysporum TaxID=5507 RepID=A0A0J9VRU0_FUSO4|nr:hypothetical protein FOXG_20848 [Fusarium oxysporum f. sp. lycopersici 4287]EXM12859.1 hypothetical protein FOTG_18665 [Fusarium oxysporum f. sp. vasinfectum 25433]KNB13598.1 hypothetical protein FOXG_20848 [Fusarium oxysporum f. sp. lycopersici 4287]
MVVVKNMIDSTLYQPLVHKADELRYYYRMFTVSLYDINYCVFATDRGLKQMDGIIGSL